MTADDRRIPLTLLAGFLGAGKTTLLTRLLADPATGRAAVIVNEFGEIGIDGRLVIGTREEIVELDGGCVCCTLRGDLATTLRDLLARRTARKPLALDRVIVEASGLAAPGPVAETLLAFDDLRAAFRLDGVVCVVHAALGRTQLERHVEAEQQAAFADLFVVHQVDRASSEEVEALVAELARRQPFAGIVRAVHGDVPGSTIFGLRERAGTEARFVRPPAAATHAPARAVVLESDAVVDLDALVLWLRFVAQRKGTSLWRAKGIVRPRGSARAAVVQAVGPFVDVAPLAGALPERSRFVLLGDGLDEAELVRGWNAVARPT